MKRLEQITNIRALAIILVVMGHSIILYSNDWGLYETIYNVPILNNLKRLINYIQMPLFFSISGFLFSISKPKPFRGFLFGKIKRLMIPYVIIGMCYLIPMRLAVGYTPYMDRSYWQLVWDCIILGTDNGHLWYLPCLFFCFVVAHPLLRAIRKLIRCAEIDVIVFSGIGLVLFLLKDMAQGPYVGNLLTYFVWFCFGGVQAYLHGTNTTKRCMLTLLLLVGLLGGLFASNLRTFAISGIMIVLVYQLIPKNENITTKVISNYSYGVYLFHSPLIYITFTLLADAHPFVVCFVNFVVFGGVALGLTAFVRKCRLAWILGES